MTFLEKLGITNSGPCFCCIEKLKEFATINNVPIINDEGLVELLKVIIDNKVVDVLEIGSAIGYSAICMVAFCGCNVTTIERNATMYKELEKNICEFKYNNKVKTIFKDALNAYDDVAYKKYDLIFIDAAKAQYIKFFNLYKDLLKPNGIIVTDNLLFHGLVNQDDEVKSRSLRGLIRKLKAFKEFLENNKEFETVFIDKGDGLAVSKKK